MTPDPASGSMRCGGSATGVVTGGTDRFKRRTSVFFGSGSPYMQAAASIDFATFWQVVFGSNDAIFLKIIVRASHHGQ